MPQVSVQTPNGMRFGIHTSDPELLGRWFAELIAREGPAYPHDMFWLQAWPLYVGRDPVTGRDVADWCVNASHGECHQMSFAATLDGVIAVLAALKDKEE